MEERGFRVDSHVTNAMPWVFGVWISPLPLICVLCCCLLLFPYLTCCCQCCVFFYGVRGKDGNEFLREIDRCDDERQKARQRKE